jgi:hypothetical protein
MTKNRHDIQTISTKRTDLQTDRVLLLGQVSETEEKTHPSHFLKFLLASRIPKDFGSTFGFAQYTNPRFAKPKEPFFCHHTDNNDDINSLQNMRN